MGKSEGPSENVESVTFSGEESVRFVRFAKQALALGSKPRVEVVGREPITSTNVRLEGRLEDAYIDGYYASIDIKTDDGPIFRVAGSNATKSIASDRVTFFRLPPELTPERFQFSKLGEISGKLPTPESSPVSVLNSITRSLRWLNSDEQNSVVESLFENVDRMSSTDRSELVEILSRVKTNRALDLLLSFSKDSDPNVRWELATAIRYLEKVVKSFGDTFVDRVVDVLVELLGDPARDVRIRAAEDIGYIINPKGADALISALSTEGDDQVRWAVVIALGRAENSNRVVPILVERATKDKFDRVRQAALLGIARRGQIVSQMVPGIADVLARIMQSGEEVEKAYAAFDLGQLGSAAAKQIPALVESMTEANSPDMQSYASLSLERLFDYITPEHRARIESILRETISKHGHKDTESLSPYHRWFLEYAGELTSALELHDLAAGCFAELAKESYDWRPFYAALSRYERAEYACRIGQLDDARRYLGEAGEILREFKGYPTDAEEGIRFRTMIIQARKNIVDGLLEWEKAVGKEFEDIESKFEQSYKIYSQFTVPRDQDITPGAKRLTEREISYLDTLKNLSLFAMHFAKIELALEEGNIDGAKNFLYLVHSNVNKLKMRMDSMPKPYLLPLVDSITKELANTIARLSRNSESSNPVQVIREGIDSVRNSYSTIGFPLVAVACPVTKLGVASISTRVPGAFSGSGETETNPILFPSDTKLVVHVEVRVQSKTRAGDTLVFVSEGNPREVTVIVPEGPFPFTIDYGIVPKSYAPLPYNMSLTFKSQTCEQTVDQKKLWIRTMSPDEVGVAITEKQQTPKQALLRGIEVQ